MKFVTVACVMAVLCDWPTAEAGSVYCNDFEGVVGAEWSEQSTSVTTSGRRFLGVFGAQTVSLAIATVPAGTVNLAFDLFVINTWDGNQFTDPLSTPTHVVGPDVWELSLASGTTLFHATFSVFDGTKAMHSFRDFPQSYPDDYPEGTNPARTGASENDTLGYFEGDSVYRLAFSFAHAGGPLDFNFSGLFPQGDPEEWGVDNILVSAVPEPSSFVVGSIVGLMGIAYLNLCRPEGRRADYLKPHG
ncbi:MAG: hypothetical protein ACKV0T_30425 [Planctomycetales bacterium]